MDWIRLLFVVVGFTQLSSALGAEVIGRFSMDDYGSVEKIDIHFHIHTENTDFVALARRDQFRFLNMAVQTGDASVMEQKHHTTFLQFRANPDRVAAVSSFPMAGWDEPDWQEKTIRYLDGTFAKGAVGVKVWKNIGMEFRDKNGKLVMIDDPKLDPIFAHLKRRKMVLIGHLGEPKNCWLPLDKMTVSNDRSYFQDHPKYHMFTPEGDFIELPKFDMDRLLVAWQEAVFALYLAEGKIEPEVVQNMRTWEHSGFSVDQSVLLAAGDRSGIERLVQYMIRCPFSLSRLVKVTDSGQVVYKAEKQACQYLLNR
jgi:hypothetical protein